MPCDEETTVLWPHITKKQCLNSILYLIAICLAPTVHLRLHHDGTNRGDSIYGVAMPSFDAKHTWVLNLGVKHCFTSILNSQVVVLMALRTVKEKRELYGKHRIAVGGSLPDNVQDDEFSGPGQPLIS